VSENAPKTGAVAIVDDDPSVRRALARLVLACGVRVETFASAEEFLSSARPEEIACLVVDVQMEEISGLELVDILAATGSSTPVIVMTSHESKGLLERVRTSGAAFLRKPIEAAALIAAVGRAIGRDLRWQDD
jgi:two-component system, LuxR family, response regulator FixJ